MINFYKSRKTFPCQRISIFKHPENKVGSSKVLLCLSFCHQFPSPIRIDFAFLCVVFQSHREWMHMSTYQQLQFYQPEWIWGCPRGEMVKAMDCGIILSEFVLQLCYYIHFGTNTLGKGMSPLILPAMGL